MGNLAAALLCYQLPNVPERRGKWSVTSHWCQWHNCSRAPADAGQIGIPACYRQACIAISSPGMLIGVAKRTDEFLAWLMCPASLAPCMCKVELRSASQFPGKPLQMVVDGLKTLVLATGRQHNQHKTFPESHDETTSILPSPIEVLGVSC